jgi:outer membrane protein TolC
MDRMKSYRGYAARWPIAFGLALAAVAVSPRLHAEGTDSKRATDTHLAAPPPAARNLRSWEDAADLLRARSTELRIALDEVRRADGQARTALAAILPSLNGNATFTHQWITNQGSQVCTQNGQPTLCPISVPQPDALDANLNASMPLINVRAWYNISTTRRAADAAAISVDDTKRTLLLATVSAIISVFTTERIAELNRIGLQTAIERRELTERRKELNSANGLDVLRAAQDVETARATVVTIHESLRQAREALGLALGVPEAVGVSHDLDLGALERSAQRVCKDQGNIDGRADIVALKARAALAARANTDVKLQFLPTLSATSTLSTTTRETGVLPRTLWDIRGVLSWNIWDGGARYGALRETDALADQAEQRLEAQRRRASIEAVQARRSVSVAEDARKVAEAARDLAREADRLTKVSFTEGRGTSLELVTAANALRQAEVTLALREFELVRARLLASLATSVCEY